MFGHGIHIGRIFGVRITLDWSLIFIFLLVAFNLAVGVFPAWHPAWSTVLAWAVGLAAAALFLASVLVHELAHSLVARAYGIPVSSITLFLFGGVANIEHDPSSPKQEALMAGVGPLTSIVLGVVFSLLAAGLTPAHVAAGEGALHAFEHMGPVATLFAWLGPINIFVGLFNLVPGYPLDGGRLLRALLWRVTHSVQKATRWAARCGQGFGWLLIITGVAMAFGVRVPLFGSGLIGGLWLAFIGWFLNAAAVSSYRQLVIKGLLEDIPVSRLMRHRIPPTIDASQNIETLVEDFIMRTGDQEFPVADHGEIVGVVRAADVRKVARSAWGITPVRQIATDIRSLHVAHPEEDAFRVLTQLGHDNTDELVVLDDGEMVGLIRREDITRWLALQSRGENAGFGKPAGR